jgi:hypothetical protein
MASTYEKIQSNTLGSASASVVFSSISSSYTDLVLIVSGKATTGTPITYYTFNSDTAANYSRTYMYGSSSTTGSGSQSAQNYIGMATINSTNFTPHIVSIMNYANTTTYKTSMYNGGLDFKAAQAALWRSTGAITSITIGITSSTYTSGSTFTLYGIKAA